MNIRSALKLAKEKFGKNAVVEARPCSLFEKPANDGIRSCTGHHPPRPCPGGIKFYRIGVIAMGMLFMVRGEGPTWEAAFQDFEERERKDHERYLAMKKEQKEARRAR